MFASVFMTFHLFRAASRPEGNEVTDTRLEAGCRNSPVSTKVALRGA